MCRIPIGREGDALIFSPASLQIQIPTINKGGAGGEKKNISPLSSFQSFSL